MASEWDNVRLGDYVDSCLGKMLDAKKNQGTFHPYLGNKQVRWGSFDLDDLSEMKFQEHEHERYGLHRPGCAQVQRGQEQNRRGCKMIRNPIKIGVIQASNGGVERLPIPVGHGGTISHIALLCYKGSTLTDPSTALKSLTLDATSKNEGNFAFLTR